MATISNPNKTNNTQVFHQNHKLTKGLERTKTTEVVTKTPHLACLNTLAGKIDSFITNLIHEKKENFQEKDVELINKWKSSLDDFLKNKVDSLYFQQISYDLKHSLSCLHLFLRIFSFPESLEPFHDMMLSNNIDIIPFLNVSLFEAYINKNYKNKIKKNDDNKPQYVFDSNTENWIKKIHAHHDHIQAEFITNKKLIEFLNFLNKIDFLKEVIINRYPQYFEFSPDGIEVKSTKLLLKILKNYDDNFCDLDCYANTVLKRSVDYKKWFENHPNYGKRFIEFISGSKSETFSNLIDYSCFLETLKNSELVKEKFRGKTIGFPLLEWLNINPDLKDVFLETKIETDKGEFVFSKIYRINKSLSPQSRAEFTQFVHQKTLICRQEQKFMRQELTDKVNNIISDKNMVDHSPLPESPNFESIKLNNKRKATNGKPPVKKLCFEELPTGSENIKKNISFIMASDLKNEDNEINSKLKQIEELRMELELKNKRLLELEAENKNLNYEKQDYKEKYLKAINKLSKYENIN